VFLRTRRETGIQRAGKYGARHKSCQLTQRTIAAKEGSATSAVVATTQVGARRRPACQAMRPCMPNGLIGDRPTIVPNGAKRLAGPRGDRFLGRPAALCHDPIVDGARAPSGRPSDSRPWPSE